MLSLAGPARREHALRFFSVGDDVPSSGLGQTFHEGDVVRIAEREGEAAALARLGDDLRLQGSDAESNAVSAAQSRLRDPLGRLGAMSSPTESTSRFWSKVVVALASSLGCSVKRTSTRSPGRKRPSKFPA